MGLLAPLAALLGLEAGSLLDRAKTAAILYGLMAGCLVLAIGFLIGAGYMALANLWSPIIAALVIAGGFLVIALAIYLGSLISERSRRRELAEKRRSSESGAFITTAALTALPMLSKSPWLLRLGIPAAAIAAFAIIRNNDDRRPR
jgi:cell division protein FtsW (lipid II flippase)